MSGGTSAASLSTAMQGAGVVSSTVGSYRKAQGDKAAYEYQSKVAANNSTIAEYQAQDAMHRGATAQNNVQTKTAQLRGSQEAMFAARGLDLAEGSPLNILSDTQFMGKRDENVVQDNTAKEVWNLRTQAANYKGNSQVLQNRANATSPLSEAAGTMLTGAGKVAASWYSRNKGSAASSSYDRSSTGDDW